MNFITYEKSAMTLLRFAAFHFFPFSLSFSPRTHPRSLIFTTRLAATLFLSFSSFYICMQYMHAYISYTVARKNTEFFYVLTFFCIDTLAPRKYVMNSTFVAIAELI